jgi:hypothetical protein
MRFNAIFLQRRTTVRVPYNLVDLHKKVIGFDTDAEVVRDLRLALDIETEGKTGNSSPSALCIQYIVRNAIESLDSQTTPVGFNPDPENDQSAFRDEK